MDNPAHNSRRQQQNQQTKPVNRVEPLYFRPNTTNPSLPQIEENVHQRATQAPTTSSNITQYDFRNQQLIMPVQAIRPLTDKQKELVRKAIQSVDLYLE